MTKRMLSLLLALVMTLSLCVPALAADEFAAEAVTEVEEQAPEAPVEPEVPEVEEPVVDEPVAEEADAPEIAAVLAEEADDPMEAAVGEITPYGGDYLETALALAKPYKARVDAGELYVNSTSFESGFQVAADAEAMSARAEAFVTAYETAELYQKGIGGASVEEDVDDGGVREIAKKLLSYIPEDDDVTAAGENELSNAVVAAMSEALLLKKGNGNNFLAKSIFGDSSDEASSELDLSKEENVENLVLKHRPELVTAVKAVVAAAKAYADIDEPVYADYTKVEKLIVAAKEILAKEAKDYDDDATEEEEGSSLNLTEADVKAFKDALDALKAVKDKKNYSSYVVKDSGTYYAADDATKGVGKLYETYEAWLDEDGMAYGGLGLDESKFEEDSAYESVMAAIEAMKLYPVDTTMKLTVTMGDEGLKSLKATVEKDETNLAKVTVKGEEAAKNAYYLGYEFKTSKGTFYYKNNKGSMVTDTVVTKIDTNKPDEFHEIATDTAFASGDNTYDWTDVKMVPHKNADGDEVKDTAISDMKFPAGSHVTVTLYRMNEYGKLVKDKAVTFDIPYDGYEGPFIDTYTEAEAKENTKVKAGDPKIEITYPEYESGIDAPAKGETYTLPNTYDGATTFRALKVDVTMTDTIDAVEDGSRTGKAGGIDYYQFVLSSGSKSVVTKGKTKDLNDEPSAASEKYTIELANATNKDTEYNVASTSLKVDFKARVITEETAQLQKAEDDKREVVTHTGTSATVTLKTVADLFKEGNNKKGDNGLKLVIDAAKALSKADYKNTLKANADAGSIKNLNGAWSLLQSHISAAQKLLDNAAKTPATGANCAAVNEAIKRIITVANWLDPKDPEDLNKDALLDAIESADDLMDAYLTALEDEDADFKWSETEGTSQPIQPLKDEMYTYASWKAFAEAYEEAQAQKAADDTTQAKIDKATAALKAAQAALKKFNDKVDLSALTAAINKAEALKEEDYTPESWAANKEAIDKALADAKAVANNPAATQIQINAAASALSNAMNALVAVKPEGPQAPASGTGWVYDETSGNDYYFKDGKMVQDYWVGDNDGASKWNLWYYMKADGTLARGFQYIDNPNGTGWYMLQADNTNGTRGQMLTGGQQTYSYSNGVVGAPIAGWGWFTTTRGADYGKCTYTSEWGDYNPANNTWAKQ